MPKIKGLAMSDLADRDKMAAAVHRNLSQSTKSIIRALTVKNKKNVAKAGMTISLGSLVLTGFMHFKGHKSVHTWSGVALVGFSIWHHRLNKRQSK